jgi:hypothetical protein
MGRAIGRARPGLVAMDYDASCERPGWPGAVRLPCSMSCSWDRPDGHVLSVFPGSPLFEADAWVSAVPAPTHIEPHVARISLHPRILQAARLPMVVAHGAGKAAILASVLSGPRTSSACRRRLPARGRRLVPRSRRGRRAAAPVGRVSEAGPFLADPLEVRSPDGTSIAVFEVRAPLPRRSAAGPSRRCC